MEPRWSEERVAAHITFSSAPPTTDQQLALAGQHPLRDKDSP